MHKKTIHFIQRNFIKLSALFIWAAVILLFYYHKNSNHYSYFDLIKELYLYISENPWGPLVYIAVYSLRPLLFFPSALLTFLSGILFGFSGGIIFTVIGENASAATGYLIGRLMGKNQANEEEKGILTQWKINLKKHDFLAVVVMRLIYMPFDLTNFMCGWLHINWIRYTLGTFIGIIPGVIIWVSIGDSVENIETFDPSLIRLNKEQLLISIGLLFISLIVAHFIYKKRRKILK